MLTTKELEKEIKDKILSILPEANFEGLYFRVGGENSSEGLYIFSKNKKYHIINTNEKGVVGRHVVCDEISEALWFALDYIAWKIAFQYAQEESKEGKDFRRALFAKEIEIYSKFGEEFKRRKIEVIEKIIGENPYSD